MTKRSQARRAASANMGVCNKTAAAKSKLARRVLLKARSLGEVDLELGEGECLHRFVLCSDFQNRSRIIFKARKIAIARKDDAR